jgi:hypothetical protein
VVDTVCRGGKGGLRGYCVRINIERERERGRKRGSRKEMGLKGEEENGRKWRERVRREG